MISSISSNSLASQIFSKLDSKSQGYLEKSDLTSAFSQISGSNSSSSENDIDQLFSAMDSDSDGKITESEFSTTLSQLQEQLDSQFNQMRMQGGQQGMPPPPPPENDSGFTKDELSSQLDQIGSTDSQRSDLISNIVNNFDEADTDGDGKVTFAEAQSYDQSSKSSSSSTSSDTTSTSSSSGTSSNSEAAVMMKIMQLVHAYGSFSEQNQQNSLLSVSA